MDDGRDLEILVRILLCFIGTGICLSIIGVILSITDLHEYVPHVIEIIKNMIHSIKSSDMSLLIEIPILILLRYAISRYYKRLDDLED